MKAITTTIPYIQQAAQLVFGDGAIDFECRYRSIDHVIANTPVQNFLEIASGFSFRSLAVTAERPCSYLDTDLAEIIEVKRELAVDLLRAEGRPADRSPAFVALNAMDSSALASAVATFPAGPVVFICEGLLMYLDEAEKRRLCASIHGALSERGGFWVTGDVYVARAPGVKPRALTPQAAQFLAQHKVQENIFPTFDAAASFFRECGFEAERHHADEVYSQLTSIEALKKLQAVNEEEVRARLSTRETWVLRPA
ncbi:MAG TPA: class I SAM-dependent methyltransferase [Blastocatellia bacterium]